MMPKDIDKATEEQLRWVKHDQQSLDWAFKHRRLAPPGVRNLRGFHKWLSDHEVLRNA